MRGRVGEEGSWWCKMVTETASLTLLILLIQTAAELIPDIAL